MSQFLDEAGNPVLDEAGNPILDESGADPETGGQTAISGISECAAIGIKIVDAAAHLSAVGQMPTAAIKLAEAQTAIDAKGQLTIDAKKLSRSETATISTGSSDTHGGSIRNITVLVESAAALDTSGQKIAGGVTEVIASGEFFSFGVQLLVGSIIVDAWTDIQTSGTLTTSGLSIRAGPSTIDGIGRVETTAESVRVSADPIIGIIILEGRFDPTVSLRGLVEKGIDIIGGITVTATRQNFTVYQGDSKQINITVPGANLNPASITVRWQSAVTVNFQPAISKSSKNSSEISLSINGEDLVISVFLLPGDTKLLTGVFHHEAKIENAPGNISTVTEGKMTIKRALIAPSE